MSRGPGKTQRAILDKLEAHLVEHPLLGDFEPNGNLRTTRDGHPPSFLTVAQLAGDDATRSATVSYRRALNALNRDGRVFLYYGHNRVMGARIIHDTEDEHVWRCKLDDWNDFHAFQRVYWDGLRRAQFELADAKRYPHYDEATSSYQQDVKRYRRLVQMRTVAEHVEDRASSSISAGFTTGFTARGATIAEREQSYRDEYNAPPEAEDDATPQRMPDEVAALMGAMHGQP